MLPRRELQTELLAGQGNALQACVASLLGEPMEKTPDFVRADDYWAAMLGHAAARGLSLVKLALDEHGRLPHSTTKGMLCILRGTSPRGAHGHVIVAAVGADGYSLLPLHDPHPDGMFLTPPFMWAAFYTALSPASIVCRAPTVVPTAEQHAVDLCECLRRPLAAAGFTVQAPFLARWYNEHPKIAPLPDVHKLDAEPDTVALLVGNSRELWPHFISWVGESVTRLATNLP